jgi:hypothetical protein
MRNRLDEFLNQLKQESPTLFNFLVVGIVVAIVLVILILTTLLRLLTGARDV